MKVSIQGSFAPKTSNLQLKTYSSTASACVKIFPLCASRAAGLRNVNLGPPVILETTVARKLKLKAKNTIRCGKVFALGINENFR